MTPFSKTKVMRLNSVSSSTCQKLCMSWAKRRDSPWSASFKNFRRIRGSGESENALDSNWIEFWKYTSLKPSSSTFYPFCSNSARIMSASSENKLPKKWELSTKNWDNNKAWLSDFSKVLRHSGHLWNIHKDKRKNILNFRFLIMCQGLMDN